MFLNRISYVSSDGFKRILSKRDSYHSQQIIGMGIDLVCIATIERLIANYDSKTLELVFTPGELKRCHQATSSIYNYALYFGVKEAVAKALTTGLVGIDWEQIEIDLTNKRSPVNLTGAAQIQAQKQNIQQWQVDWWQLEQDSYLLIQVVATGTKRLRKTYL